MSEKDLIRFKKGDPNTKLQSLGGSKATPAKKEAAKVRELKKLIKTGKLKTKHGDWLIERVMNPDAMAIDLLGYADQIKSQLDPSQQIAWLNAVTNLKRSIHGETHKNINMNVNVDIDEFHKRMLE